MSIEFEILSVQGNHCSINYMESSDICINKLLIYSVLYLFLFLDLVEFTDEEGYGKFLDMHVLHDQYLNLKKLEVSVRVPDSQQL